MLMSHAGEQCTLTKWSILLTDVVIQTTGGFIFVKGIGITFTENRTPRDHTNRKVIEMKRTRPTRLHASAKIERQQAELLTLASKALGLCSRLMMAQKEIEDQARIDVKNHSAQPRPACE
jgi:hypothetical protein